MAEFIPEMKFAQFKQLKAGELKELKSFAVTSNGSHLMTIIIPRTDFIQVQAERIAELSNSVGGKDIEQMEVS